MDVRATPLDGMLLLARAVHSDPRGTFDVLWSREKLKEAGVAADFVQDNLIETGRGVLRGMHFQTRHPQGKLLTLLTGEVFEAAVDLRPDSPTFGKSHGFVLCAGDRTSLWLPPGFAHGFLALSERVTYLYAVTAPWDPEEAHVLAWDDPEIAIAWPLAPGQAPILSDRDRSGRSLAAVRSALR